METLTNAIPPSWQPWIFLALFIGTHLDRVWRVIIKVWRVLILVGGYQGVWSVIKTGRPVTNDDQIPPPPTVKDSLQVQNSSESAKS